MTQLVNLGAVCTETLHQRIVTCGQETWPEDCLPIVHEPDKVCYSLAVYARRACNIIVPSTSDCAGKIQATEVQEQRFSAGEQ